LSVVDALTSFVHCNRFQHTMRRKMTQKPSREIFAVLSESYLYGVTLSLHHGFQFSW
jgi:hypothetical protein